MCKIKNIMQAFFHKASSPWPLPASLHIIPFSSRKLSYQISLRHPLLCWYIYIYIICVYEYIYIICTQVHNIWMYTHMHKHIYIWIHAQSIRRMCMCIFKAYYLVLENQLTRPSPGRTNFPALSSPELFAVWVSQCQKSPTATRAGSFH